MHPSISRSRRVAAILAALAFAAALVPAGASAAPTLPQVKPAKGYRVGVADRTINPDPDGTFAGKPVYLGGFGFGGGTPATPGRPATGVLRDGLHVRAFAVSDGERSFAIADIETQGWFAATKDGPYGLIDMRKAVARRTGGALAADRVVIQSDHSHSGPDALGIWGGVPVEYRRYIVQRTVDAIVEAYQTMRPGRLYYGTAPGRDLLSNQFDYDPANQSVDSDVRVLQARDPAGRAFATLLNFSAHGTVLGSSNTKASGDWVQAANTQLEQRFGGEAVTVVGTLGRTQPARDGCADTTLKGDAESECKIDGYAAGVVDRAAVAVANAQPLTGEPTVDARSYLIQDPATNAVILGAEATDPLGASVNRAVTPPWLAGNVLGTITATARIGDVLLSSGPGEMYPQIPLKVAELVPARGYMTAGLANDQIGYVIGPFEALVEPIRRSALNESGDQVEPISNDNYFFAASNTIGERLTCSLLRGAGEVMGKGLAYRNAYDRCGLFVNDLLLPAGADTR